MASVYLSARSNAPGSSELVLINGEPSTTGYRLLNVDVGNPAFDKQYSGPRGTLGAVLAGETAQNRLSTFRLQAVGTSQDDLETKLSTLWLLDEQLRRYGGTVVWRPQGGSFRMRITVLDSGVALEALEVNLFVLNNRSNVSFGVVSGPYYEGEALDIFDGFFTDTESSYTFDTGSAADVSVDTANHLLTAGGNLSSEKRLIHTDRGYNYGDHQVTLKAVPGSTITSFKAGVVLKRIDASNYLEAYVDDNGSNSRLRIDKVVATVRTNLATTNLPARVVNGTAFWVQGRIEGGVLWAEYFTTAPSPMAGVGSPNAQVNATLAGADLTAFGPSASGKAGISWVPQQAAATLDDFDAKAYVYRNIALPDVFSLYGPSYGDARSLGEVEITPSGGSAAPVWAAVGWWKRPSAYNRCWNGDFESALLLASGWSVAAVTNINGAATSLVQDNAAAKFGNKSGLITCPATADTGANFRIFRRFKKGVTYTAEAWVRAASATTTTYLRLGNGAANDKASSANVALSTTWTLKTVSWIPTADRDDAHVAINIAAATGTVFQIDGVSVYEGTTAPSSVGQIEGRGGIPPLGIVEAESGDGAIVANAGYRSGFAITQPGGIPENIIIDPGLLVSDDYAADTISVEAWGRFQFSTATTVGLAAQPISISTGLPSVYTEEFQAAPKVVPAPTGSVLRMIRLGTLRLNTSARYAMRPFCSSGTMDYFVLLPSAQRALSPTGKPNDASFPRFVGATGEITRTIRADLSGRYREPNSPEFAAPGLGGSLIELPVGDIDLVVKLSSMVPDDPTLNATTEQLAHSATVHVAVTPRWRLARGS